MCCVSTRCFPVPELIGFRQACVVPLESLRDYVPVWLLGRFCCPFAAKMATTQRYVSIANVYCYCWCQCVVDVYHELKYHSWAVGNSFCQAACLLGSCCLCTCSVAHRGLNCWHAAIADSSCGWFELHVENCYPQSDLGGDLTCCILCITGTGGTEASQVQDCWAPEDRCQQELVSPS